jgi:hypothetical protein
MHTAEVKASPCEGLLDASTMCEWDPWDPPFPPCPPIPPDVDLNSHSHLVTKVKKTYHTLGFSSFFCFLSLLVVAVYAFSLSVV